MTAIVPPFPIVVGVTSERHIAADVESAVREAVRGALAGLRARIGEALWLMLALSDGADQLVADVAESLSGVDGDAPINMIARSPVPLADYRASLRDMGRFDHHWARAAPRIELPAIGDRGVGDLQREQLNVVLSRRSHLLLALWEGKTPEGAVDPGGPAAVVAMRRDGEESLPGFRRSTLFSAGVAWLGLSQRGPIVHIVSQGRDAGDVLVDVETASPPSDAPPPATTKRVAPAEVFAALGDVARRELEDVCKLNAEIAGFGDESARMLAGKLLQPAVDDLPTPHGSADGALVLLRHKF